jgi:uncharacterized protein with GYD domain
MPTFVFLQKAPDHGAAGISAGPSKGAARQAEAIRALGGTVQAQFAVIGRFDIVLIADVPNDETALAISLRAQEEGFYTEALRAFTPEDADKAVSLLSKLDVTPE